MLYELLKNFNNLLEKYKKQDTKHYLRKLTRDKIAFYIYNESKYSYTKMNSKLKVNYNGYDKNFKLKKELKLINKTISS